MKCPRTVRQKVLVCSRDKKHGGKGAARPAPRDKHQRVSLGGSVCSSRTPTLSDQIMKVARKSHLGNFAERVKKIAGLTFTTLCIWLKGDKAARKLRAEGYGFPLGDGEHYAFFFNDEQVCIY